MKLFLLKFAIKILLLTEKKLVKMNNKCSSPDSFCPQYHHPIHHDRCQHHSRLIHANESIHGWSHNSSHHRLPHNNQHYRIVYQPAYQTTRLTKKRLSSSCKCYNCPTNKLLCCHQSNELQYLCLRNKSLKVRKGEWFDGEFASVSVNISEIVHRALDFEGEHSLYKRNNA